MSQNKTLFFRGTFVLVFFTKVGTNGKRLKCIKPQQTFPHILKGAIFPVQFIFVKRFGRLLAVSFIPDLYILNHAIQLANLNLLSFANTRYTNLGSKIAHLFKSNLFSKSI